MPTAASTASAAPENAAIDPIAEKLHDLTAIRRYGLAQQSIVSLAQTIEGFLADP